MSKVTVFLLAVLIATDIGAQAPDATQQRLDADVRSHAEGARCGDGARRGL